MSNIQLFNFESNEIRVIEIDGEPWFVGKDIAIALGYANTKDAIIKHVETEEKRGVAIPDSIGRQQETTVINESGMYSLILGSRLESAKPFKRWVTSEVLPSIRKTGTYIAPTATNDQLTNLIQTLITKVTEQDDKISQINKVNTDTINYLTEQSIKKDNLITVYEEENIKLNTLFLEYPGLKDAINFMINYNDINDRFTLKSYLENKPNVIISRGSRIQVGQLVSNWVKLSTGEQLSKFNGATVYESRHERLINLALRYVQDI